VLFKKLFLISRQLTLLPLEKAILFFQERSFQGFFQNQAEKTLERRKKDFEVLSNWFCPYSEVDKKFFKQNAF
jgi:hypothetical protein